MDKYSPSKIEPKWVKFWEEKGLYRAIDSSSANGQNGSKKPKKYLLIEFPYPSGERLHVGHGRSYCCLDAMARLSRMKGFNVLYPIGWDAFGLPAENYAIKTGINPAITTKQNIANAKAQAKSWGLSFDWSREINTTDPSYYKWTQWIFLQLFKKGLVFKADVSVNWCPNCKTNLADEEVLSDGTHERCGEKTEKRMQKQWLIKITAYAEQLLKDLDLVDFREDIKRQQINWIGKKEGINITYKIEDSAETVTVFTTRPDTNFGATFIVLAPENPLCLKITTKEHQQNVRKYINNALNKSELERISEARKKTGVFTGRYAINQLNNYRMPIYVADFVIYSVGTGAVVGVPGHDKRDFEFAKEFNLEVKRVVVGKDGDTSTIKKIEQVQEEEGKMINSSFLNGLDIHQATKKIMDYLEKKGWGKRSVSYHLRDWVFSRQHYWGEPIPMIFCEHCAKKGISYGNVILKRIETPLKDPLNNRGILRLQQVQPQNDEDMYWEKMAGWFPVPESELPVKLPYVEKYQPSGTGESPLAKVKDWVNVACPNCGGSAKRETDTMPNWAGSNWYFLGYIIAKKLSLSCHAELVSASKPNIKEIPKRVRDDSNNSRNIFAENKDLLKYWLPIDLYNGGMEHTTLHLLYSRFIYKFLYDLGLMPSPEPYARRWSHGVVLGPDNRKMSKSRGNVINPDEIVKKYGADTFRLYEGFMGPFEQMIAWDEKGVKGCYRFLSRVWNLVVNKLKSLKLHKNLNLWRLIYKTTKKVEDDIWHLSFNTAIASLMELCNAFYASKEEVTLSMLKHYLLLLAPFAPFISEELWQAIRNQESEIRSQNNYCSSEARTLISIHQQLWPAYKKEFLTEEEVTIAIQVNGKLRDTMKVGSEKCENQNKLEQFAKNREKIAKYLKGKKIKKVIYVKGRLINFVV